MKPPPRHEGQTAGPLAAPPWRPPVARPLAAWARTRHEALRMTDPTREAALDLVAAVLDRFRPLEEALDGLPPMDARDPMWWEAPRSPSQMSTSLESSPGSPMKASALPMVTVHAKPS